MALCSRLNFSDRSCSGWKNRRVSWMNAASTPTVSVPPSDAEAAVPEQEGQGDGGQQLDDREEDRVDRDRAEMRVEVLPVERLEPPRRVRLAAEQLHHPHAGEPLLQEGVDPRQPYADVAEGLAHAAAEDAGRELHERDHRERDQRQPPVERPASCAMIATQGEEVAEDRHHAGGEQLVERLDVGGHARHQPADRVAVEVAEC